MADKEGEEKVPGKGGGDFWKKYKFYVIGGVAIIGVLVFFFVRQSNANTASSGSGATTTPNPNALAALGGIDPATGIPYADEFGMFNTGNNTASAPPPLAPSNTSTTTTTNYFYGTGQGPSLPGSNPGFTSKNVVIPPPRPAVFIPAAQRAA